MSEQTGQGLNPREYWTLSAVSVACVMLVVINISLARGNRDIRQQVNQRQAFITQSLQLDKVNKQLVNAIAQLAVRNNDSALERVLSDQGITINRNSSNADAQAGQ